MRQGGNLRWILVVIARPVLSEMAWNETCQAGRAAPRKVCSRPSSVSGESCPYASRVNLCFYLVFDLSPETNLAEVASFFQIVEGLPQFVELKNPIHHGLHPVKFNRPVHRFKHGPRADIDRLDPSALAHEGD